MLLVKYDATADAPTVNELSAAEAAARLYPSIMNALAHEGDGLAAAARLAQSVRCFALESAGIAATSAAVVRALGDSL